MLTTLAKVQAHLKLAAGVDEALLTTLITAAQKIIERHCDRAFDAADYTQYYDGNGERDMFLDQYPVISVTSLHVDSERNYGSDTLLTEADDFLVYKEEGRIRLISGSSILSTSDTTRFNKVEQSVKIVYRAGYATIPGDLELAANEMVGHLYRNRGVTSNIASKSVGGWSETYRDKPDAIPNHVQAMLFTYRKMTLEVRGATS